MLTCPKCGSVFPDDSKFCQKCGTKLSQPVGNISHGANKEEKSNINISQDNKADSINLQNSPKAEPAKPLVSKTENIEAPVEKQSSSKEIIEAESEEGKDDETIREEIPDKIDSTSHFADIDNGAQEEAPQVSSLANKVIAQRVIDPGPFRKKKVENKIEPEPTVPREPSPRQPELVSGTPLEKALYELKMLYEHKIITGEEYSSRKKKLLLDFVNS